MRGFAVSGKFYTRRKIALAPKGFKNLICFEWGSRRNGNLGRAELWLERTTRAEN